MYRVLTLVLVTLVGTATGYGQSKKREVEQKEFISPEYKYVTHFPEKAPKTTTRKLKTENGELTQATASVEFRDSTYSVTVTLLPDAVAFAGAKAVIDGTRDGIKGKEGKVERDEDIKQGDAKLPARELLFDFRKNQMRTRILLVENRLYQVTVTGPKAVVIGETANRFFSAFEIRK